MIAASNAESHGDGMKGYGRLISRVRVVLFFTVGGMLITGCGVLGSPPVAVTASPAASVSSGIASDAPVPAAARATQAAPDPWASACMLGTNGQDVEVAIGNSSESCAYWVSDLAHDGLVWGGINGLALPGSPGPADGETESMRCDLTDGTQEMLVMDAGGAIYGDSICSYIEQDGWTPQQGPLGAALSAAQASADAAQASADAAAASASAAAAASQSAADLRTQTANDDSTLNGDVSSLQGDLSTYAADLATANADGKKASGEPKCNSDGSPDTDTYDDATSWYDDGSSVYDDESNLTNDIGSVQSDVTALNADLAAMGGTEAGTPAANDITTAQTVMGKAQKLVNAAVSNTIQNDATNLQTAIDACGS